jgi:hypothetical protein
MKNTIELYKILWNDKYSWDKNGDEWSDQALRCNVVYGNWKQSLVPNMTKTKRVN